MALTAAMTMTSGSAISGASTRFILTITNTGASAVNVSYVQGVVQTARPGAIGYGNAGAGQLFGPDIYSESTIQVGASGTLSLGMRGVFFGNTYPGSFGNPSGQFFVSAIVTTDDGSTFQSPQLSVVVSDEIVLPPRVGYGSLQFNSGINSAFIL